MAQDFPTCNYGLEDDHDDRLPCDEICDIEKRKEFEIEEYEYFDYKKPKISKFGISTSLDSEFYKNVGQNIEPEKLELEESDFEIKPKIKWQEITTQENDIYELELEQSIDLELYYKSIIGKPKPPIRFVLIGERLKESVVNFQQVIARITEKIEYTGTNHSGIKSFVNCHENLLIDIKKRREKDPETEDENTEYNFIKCNKASYEDLAEIVSKSIKNVLIKNIMVSKRAKSKSKRKETTETKGKNVKKKNEMKVDGIKNIFFIYSSNGYWKSYKTIEEFGEYIERIFQILIIKQVIESGNSFWFDFFNYNRFGTTSCVTEFTKTRIFEMTKLKLLNSVEELVQSKYFDQRETGLERILIKERRIIPIKFSKVIDLTNMTIRRMKKEDMIDKKIIEQESKIFVNYGKEIELFLNKVDKKKLDKFDLENIESILSNGSAIITTKEEKEEEESDINDRDKREKIIEDFPKALRLDQFLRSRVLIGNSFCDKNKWSEPIKDIYRAYTIWNGDFVISSGTKPLSFESFCKYFTKLNFESYRKTVKKIKKTMFYPVKLVPLEYEDRKG